MRRALLAALSAVSIAGLPSAVAAQIPGLDEWAAVIAAGQGRTWAGQRVDEPPPSPRPRGGPAERSVLRPLDVHAEQGVPERAPRVALDALETAYDSLRRLGWDPPAPDGGRGGTAGFDLYLVHDPERADDARADGRVAWSFLDSDTAFGVVDGDLPDDLLGVCATSAYAQAVLLGQDPSEAPSARHATATYLTWLVTGAWGCDEDALRVQQTEPFRDWIAGGARDGDGGALFLAHVASRHDGGAGTFVHDIWQVARQRTWEGVGLRGSPDVWEALEAIVGLTDDTIEEIVESLAVQRWFAGRAAATGLVGELPRGARVPIRAAATWEQLPRQTPPADPPLEVHGSGYVRVDVRGAPPGASLRIWLRGEYGVEWSLIALRFDEHGRDLGRMTAPPRRTPESYLLLELVPGTAEVILVTTNLGSRIPDADEKHEDGRSYRLILDKAE